MKKILLCDSLNLAIRCFCAIATTNSDGDHNGILFGAIASLRKAIETTRPDRVVMVWDGRGGSARRKKIYPEYKAGRGSSRMTTFEFFNNIEEERQSLYKQIARFKEYCDILPVNQIQIDGLEADDVIAYYATKMRREDEEIVILSTDKDYLQLVNDKVSIYSPIKDLIINELLVRKNYSEGVPSKNFVLLRAFSGDNSDNVPGIKGIGMKTAIKLYPELLSEEKINPENIYKFTIEKTASSNLKGYKTVLENFGQFQINYILMDLQDIPCSPDQLRQMREQINQPHKLFKQTQLSMMFTRDKLWKHFHNADRFSSTFNRLHGLSLMYNRIDKQI